MGLYKKMKDRQSKEFNSLPLGCAFSNPQFEEMMSKWGLSVDDTDKIASVGFGAFIQKKDIPLLIEITKKHTQERKEMMSNFDYLVDMFSFELANHEYGYTHDLSDTLEACELTVDDINKNELLRRALYIALKKI